METAYTYDGDGISHQGMGFQEMLDFAINFLIWSRKMDTTKIYQCLDRLIMQPVRVIGRASNMLWIGIGEKVEKLNYKGEKREISTYSIHVQCMWRMINKERMEILFASSDYYSPSKKADKCSCFDWEPQGNNLFDEKSKKWLMQESPIYIREYKINIWGDLLLVFTNNDRLEIFISSSNETEGWRILEAEEDKPHLVATGLGMNFE